MTSPVRQHRRGARRAQAVAVLIAALLGVALAVGGPAAHAAPGDPYEPPSVTVETPSTDDCAQRDKPPPAIDTSEDVPPGATPPEPLPVPEFPVGGGRLGECGLVVPEGAPALPADIAAGAWLLADLTTGEVLAAKDPHGRYRPASTLKLLTAHVMLTNLTDLDQVVEGSFNDSAQEGTRVGLEAGGQYTVRQLITYLVIISGNDAANALARVNGGYDKTIADLNATARALGALDTRAATPSGLDGPGQSTSAYDLALFARADMTLPEFPGIVSSVDVRVPAAAGEGYIAANDNQLLYQYPGALGGKTGFTDDANHTYVGMAERDGRRLVVTMMNGAAEPRRQWMQGASLLDWGFALPAGAAPVGQLVGSLAEATARPVEQTPSTAASGPTATSEAALTSSAPAAQSSSAAFAATGSSSGISGGAIAAIAAAVAAAIVAAALLVRRRRRSGASESAAPTEASATSEASATTEANAPTEPLPTAQSAPSAPSAQSAPSGATPGRHAVAESPGDGAGQIER